jgi:hypothetical protein
MKFYGFALTGIDLLQGREACVEGDEVAAPDPLKTDRLIQRHLYTGTLARTFTPCMVHQDLAHEASRYAVKMGTILPVGAALINEAKARLMNQRRRLQGVAPALFPQVTGGQ